MEDDDPLGNEGRKHVTAVMKVEVFQKPTRDAKRIKFGLDMSSQLLENPHFQGLTFQNKCEEATFAEATPDLLGINLNGTTDEWLRVFVQCHIVTSTAHVHLVVEQCGISPLPLSVQAPLYHGTGFVISDHHVITCYHVIAEALSDKTNKYEICISNETTGKLLCEVIQHGPENDLALLYCKDLNVEQCGISPLPLSVQAPLQSQGVFILGYPFTYTGKRALFKKGYVTGFLDRYGRPPFLVVDCCVSPGFSGSPVLRWIKGQLQVVAVLTQRHKKDIRTIEEMNTHEEIRSTLEKTSLVNDDSRPDTRSSLDLLTLRTCDALEETHGQFGFCNAVSGDLVIKFILKGVYPL